MNSYRKPDQEYADDYDRSTIKKLKELEAKEDEEKANAASEWELLELSMKHSIKHDSFKNTGIRRARNRDSFIRKLKQQDEEKDYLVSTHPTPQNVRCNTCNVLMRLGIHFFDDKEPRLLFVFDCPNSYKPKKVLYPNGTEYFFPERRCEECGGKFISTSIKTETKLTFIETCERCKKEIIDEYDLTKKKDEPITEADRKKYCLDFTHKRTFHEDLQAIADFAEYMEKQNEEKKIKEQYGFENIQKISIPQLEKRLTALIEGCGYIKLNFEQPSSSQHTIIAFSIQDPTDRTEDDSIKQLKQLLVVDLFHTNWRLAKSELYYRLGFLTGKLKGFDHEEDLIKLAKEVFESKK